MSERRDVVIFGTGDYARVAAVYLREDSDYDVVAFTVDAEYVHDQELAGIPVVSFDEPIPERCELSSIAVGPAESTSGGLDIEPLQHPRQCQRREARVLLGRVAQPRFEVPAGVEKRPDVHQIADLRALQQRSQLAGEDLAPAVDSDRRAVETLCLGLRRRRLSHARKRDGHSGRI